VNNETNVISYLSGGLLIDIAEHFLTLFITSRTTRHAPQSYYGSIYLPCCRILCGFSRV